MAVELQGQERLARCRTHKALHKRIGPALEVRHVDHVEVRVRGDQLRRGQDPSSVFPEHVVVDVADIDIGQGHRIDRHDVHAVVVTEFAGDRERHAGIMDIVGPADEDDPALSSVFEPGQGFAPGRLIGCPEPFLCGPPGCKRPVRNRPLHAQPGRRRHQDLPEMLATFAQSNGRAQDPILPGSKRGGPADHERQGLAPRAGITIVVGELALGRHDVRQPDVVHVPADQLGDVAVGDDDREAGLRDDAVIPEPDAPVVGLFRNDDLEPAVAEEPPPQRQQIELRSATRSSMTGLRSVLARLR